MNVEYYIAKRLVKSKNKNSFSSPIIKISIAAIAIGLAVMIISVAIVTGFKNEIIKKITGFGSHIQIVNFDNNSSFETFPISENQIWIDELTKIDGIKSVNKFIVKAGIIKTEQNLQGVVFKGVAQDYNWSFFNQYLVEGQVPKFVDSIKSNDCLISKKIANILNLKTGDSFVAYFIQDPPRMRKFRICGIYDTQLEEIDNTFIFVDIKHLQKLNDWENNEITGFEIHLSNIDKITDYEIIINRIIGNNYSPDGNILKVRNIKEEYPGIFDWLSLLDINVWVILILMISVAGFNMITGLLVIILEKVNLIGVLKSIGAQNIQIEKIFIYLASMLITKGLLIGNIIGIGLCIIQKYTGLVQLDPQSYYISSVPINLNIMYILLLNIGAILITILMMFLPAKLITKINPSDSIRFN